MDISATITGSWGATLICGFEVQKNGIGQTDDSSRWDWRFQIPIPILSIFVRDAGGDLLPVDGSPELTDILQKKSAGGWIPADPAVFAGNIGRRSQLQVDPKALPAAARSRSGFWLPEILADPPHPHTGYTHIRAIRFAVVQRRSPQKRGAW